MTDTVRTLPWSPKLGYPQSHRVTIAGRLYDLSYRWNYALSAPVFTVTDLETGAIVRRIVLRPLCPYAIRDPVTGALRYTLLPRTVDRARCTIWVFVEGET